MGFGDEVSISSEEEVHPSLDDFTHDKLMHAFNDLFEDHVAYMKKSKVLRKKNKVLQRDYDDLLNEKNVLDESFENLARENEILKRDFENLSQENLSLKEENKILGKKDVVIEQCANCLELHDKVCQLENVISKFNKPQKDLANVLNQVQFC